MALKILLADDNITAQKMGSKILSDAGYTVVPVSNGAAAMKKIVAEKPELIILDVYMPGYTGLEVCEKVKNAAETARVPVLLTVTNMEPFNAEDGNRVKADGVLIKPFEATDLLAVVHKFEEKLHPAAPAEEEYPATQKIEAVKEFEDKSYAEWKAEAAPEEDTVTRTPEMSHEVASAPALGIEGLAPAEQPFAPEEPFAAETAPPAFTMESQPEPAPVPTFDLNAPAPAFDVNQPAPAFDVDQPAPGFDLGAPAPVFELEHAQHPVEAEAVIAPPAELEFTSAPKTEMAEVTPAAELEVTLQEAAEVPVVQDAALVTDPTEIAQFATKFGEEHPEEIPVGIAMEQPPEQAEAIAETPEPVVEQVPPEPPSPHWADADVRQSLGFTAGAAAAAAPAREAEPEVGVDTQPLDVLETPASPAEEPAPAMEPAPELAPPVVEVAPEPEPLVEIAPEPEAAPAAETPDITQKLVADFVAELERAQAEAPPQPEPAPQPEMEPPAEAATSVAGAPDDQRVAEAVNRVLERYKGELVAAIVRELKS